jgi:hypothetical protein
MPCCGNSSRAATSRRGDAHSASPKPRVNQEVLASFCAPPPNWGACVYPASTPGSVRDQHFNQTSTKYVINTHSFTVQ